MAIIALGKIGDPIAATHIFRHLTNGTSTIARAFAAEVLAKLEYKPAITQLLNMLEDKDWLNRESAAEGLGFFADESTVPALLKALRDEKARVAAEAAISLGCIKSASSIEGLIEALKHEDCFVREHSVEALRFIGDTRVLPYLKALLDDKSDLVRRQVKGSIEILEKKNLS